MRYGGRMKRLPFAVTFALLATVLAGCGGPAANSVGNGATGYSVVNLTVTAKSVVSDGSVDETVGAPCGFASNALVAANGIEMGGGINVEEANGDYLGGEFWKCTVTKIDDNAPNDRGNPGIQISVAYKCTVEIQGTPLGDTIKFVSGNWSSAEYPVTDIKPNWELTIAAN
jgi:hypothetical protein